MLDPQIIAKSFLMQIEQRRDFLAPLEATGDHCWQILLWIYCSPDPTMRSAKNLAEAVHLPRSTAERLLRLLAHYSYVEWYQSDAICEIELTCDVRQKFEQLLMQMDYPTSPGGG